MLFYGPISLLDNEINVLPITIARPQLPTGPKFVKDFYNYGGETDFRIRSFLPNPMKTKCFLDMALILPLITHQTIK